MIRGNTGKRELKQEPPLEVTIIKHQSTKPRSQTELNSKLEQ